jgi:hypothetical protein
MIYALAAVIYLLGIRMFLRQRPAAGFDVITATPTEAPVP